MGKIMMFRRSWRLPMHGWWLPVFRGCERTHGPLARTVTFASFFRQSRQIPSTQTVKCVGYLVNDQIGSESVTWFLKQSM